MTADLSELWLIEDNRDYAAVLVRALGERLPTLRVRVFPDLHAFLGDLEAEEPTRVLQRVVALILDLDQDGELVGFSLLAELRARTAWAPLVDRALIHSAHDKGWFRGEWVDTARVATEEFGVHPEHFIPKGWGSFDRLVDRIEALRKAR